SYTFTNAGTFPYFCIPHRSQMRGTITVEAASSRPTIQITSQTNNDSLPEPASFDLVADPAAGSSPVEQVEFFDGTNLLATLTTIPWTLSLSNQVAGTHTYHARATDSGAMQGTSPPVTVTVVSGTGSDISLVELAGLGLHLEWEGGAASFLVQKKTSITNSDWVNVLTTEDEMTVVPRDTDTAFFRIQSGATAAVKAFTVWMNGASERPDPVDS